VAAFEGYVRRNRGHNDAIFLAEIRSWEGCVTGAVVHDQKCAVLNAGLKIGDEIFESHDNQIFLHPS
jgi:hypothetical protein